LTFEVEDQHERLVDILTVDALSKDGSFVYDMDQDGRFSPIGKVAISPVVSLVEHNLLESEPILMDELAFDIEEDPKTRFRQLLALNQQLFKSLTTRY
jgi:hypothetical protein